MKTDWDAYYRRPNPAARYSRRITGRILTDLIGRFREGRLDTIVELGGAGSCLLELINRKFAPRRYWVIDNNQTGLDLISRRFESDGSVSCCHQDVLDLRVEMQADLVLSVGLIEHFSPADTRRAILAHFRLLRPGGIAIITFPTPTWLYRLSRRVCEFLGLWRFPDERPVRREEVAAVIDQQADILYEKINWPILFTQMIIVARRRSPA